MMATPEITIPSAESLGLDQVQYAVFLRIIQPMTQLNDAQCTSIATVVRTLGPHLSDYRVLLDTPIRETPDVWEYVYDKTTQMGGQFHPIIKFVALAEKVSGLQLLPDVLSPFMAK